MHKYTVALLLAVACFAADIPVSKPDRSKITMAQIDLDDHTRNLERFERERPEQKGTAPHQDLLAKVGTARASYLNVVNAAKRATGATNHDLDQKEWIWRERK